MAMQPLKCLVVPVPGYQDSQPLVMLEAQYKMEKIVEFQAIFHALGHI